MRISTPRAYHKTEALVSERPTPRFSGGVGRINRNILPASRWIIHTYPPIEPRSGGRHRDALLELSIGIDAGPHRKAWGVGAEMDKYRSDLAPRLSGGVGRINRNIFPASRWIIHAHPPMEPRSGARHRDALLELSIGIDAAPHRKAWGVGAEMGKNRSDLAPRFSGGVGREDSCPFLQQRPALLSPS